MSDEQLVLSFLKGDESALEAIIERYLKQIYNFIYQLVGDACAAQDITQDVFVKLWLNASSFDDKKKFSTWIYAIAKNTALDFLRKKSSIPFVAFENEDGGSILEYIVDDRSLSSEEILSIIDMRNDTEELLASLPVILRTIILLHHKNNFTLVEIAEILGQSKNTVKSKYRRAILQLREKAVFEENHNRKIAPKPSSAS